MVKIAVAGGSGNVAQEIIDVLVATGRHEILILSRKDIPTESTPGITWIKANYEDTESLTQILQGVHTVLSFVSEQESQSSPFQKNLIDAAIKAGVKRFAPSEWATSGTQQLSWYAYKKYIRGYLEEVNKKGKVLEYTLFQPGLFVNYFTRPYKSTKHIHQMEIMIDFENRRAIIIDGSEDAKITLTAVQDLANVVSKAIDYEGEWPVVGGIHGTTISIGDFIKLGEKVRGGPFTVEKVTKEEFEKGDWETSWVPRIDHPSIPVDQVDIFSRVGVAGILLGISAGAFKVSDAWNRLLPDYEFVQAQGFLEEAWEGKP
ncbi:NAD(P)-binding protein [Aspergillus cavernicola]|uniref:NAD(P)-binding protein n=1 Tax=Aspergillus cavernicola TaxID=176166 RepID=A0ABR4IC74_9EURO